MGQIMDDAERTIRQLRVDARQQQEEAEAIAAELALASRTLRDAILDHARGGWTLRVELGSSVVVGSAVHVGTDLVRVMGASREPIDVCFDAISAVQASDVGTGPVAVSTGYPDTVLARARELVQANARVEIGRRDAPAVRGRLRAATTTHVEIDEGVPRWLVPLSAMAWIRRIGG